MDIINMYCFEINYFTITFHFRTRKSIEMNTGSAKTNARQHEFCRKTKYFIDGHKLQLSKNLGVLFEHILRFGEHYNHIINNLYKL